MPYLSAEAVKTRRERLKKEFPEIKFSVTRSHHSGVTAAIMESPYDWPQPYMQLNTYYLERHPHADVLERIREILNEGNGTLVEDGDYGTVPRFYIYINIGKWDKPHIRRQA